MKKNDELILEVVEDTEPELDSVIIAKLLKDAINELEEEARKRPQPEPPQPSLESLGEKVAFGTDETEHLNESEDYTLPAQKVFQWINKELVDARSQGAVKGFEIRPKIDDGDPKSYPILRVACVSSLAYNFETILKERLEFYGWYIGFKKQEPHELRPGVFVLRQEFLVEPNFPVQNDRVDAFTQGVVAGAHGGLFYHVTFAKFADKINREGLVPSKTGRDLFRYPDRVYLFTNQNAAMRYATMHVTPRVQNSQLNHTIAVNKRYIGNSGKNGTPKTEAEPQYQDPSAGMVIFTVNLGKMLSDGRPIKLYHDNRFGTPGIAYFTANSIPPKYLTRGGSIGISSKL